MLEGGSGAGSVLRPPRRPVKRRKIDGRPWPGSPAEGAAGAARSGPEPGSAAGIGAGRAGAGPASGLPGGVGLEAAGPVGRAGPGVSGTGRGGVGGAAGGVAPAGSGLACFPLAGSGCRPWRRPLGAPASGPRGGEGPADRRGSSPRWRRSERDRTVGSSAGWPPGTAEDLSLGEGESLAAVVLGLPAGVAGVEGPAARVGWPVCGPGLAVAPPVPCPASGGSGGMAVAGP